MSSSFLHQFPSVRSKVETNLMFESLVHQMIEHSCKMGEAGAIRSLGIALEARRLDLVCIKLLKCIFGITISLLR
jgi:hypothetical protein